MGPQATNQPSPGPVNMSTAPANASGPSIAAAPSTSSQATTAGSSTGSPLSGATLPPVPGTTPPSAGGSSGGPSTGRPTAAQRADYFRNIGPKTDLNQWIDSSGLFDGTAAQKAVFKEDLNKIRKLGIWEDPQNPGNANTSWVKQVLQSVPLKACRVVMAASWIATGAGLVGLACLAPVGLVFWAPAAIAANWVIQKVAGWLHNQKFESTFNELRSEMAKAGSLQAGIAWAGVMHEFLDKHNPLLILPNHSKMKDFLDPGSIDAVKRQLRQAAQYAADKLETGSSAAGSFFKDQFFNDMLAQNDRVLDDFAKRCTGFPKESASYTNPLTIAKRILFGK